MTKKLIYKKLGTKVVSVNEETYEIDFIFSTGDTDRHDEIIDQKGWKLTEFLSNPVVLFAHDQHNPAVGKVVSVSMENGQLEGRVKFAAEEYPFAKVLFNLYKNGFMRAVSVGFMNLKYSFDEAKEQLILLENELYELSLVNVPANAQALAKCAGMDIEPLEKRLADMDAKRRVEFVEEKSDDIEKMVSEILQKQLQRSDDSDKKTKVETPRARDGKKGMSNKKINKAIRELLREKKNIKS